MIDLADYKDRYRLRWDESRQGKERDPWLRQIPCKRGYIAPHGDRTLAVYLDHRGKTGMKVLANVPGARLHQRGDNEMTIVFDVDQLDAVAKVVGAKRRRQMSDAQREAAIVRLAKYRSEHPSKQGLQSA